MPDVHIGLIGAGNISETHAAAAGAIEGVRITAVCGRTREKAERLAVRCGAAAYTDLDRFLAHVPLDLVVIGSRRAFTPSRALPRRNAVCTS
jgi:predicted dehydrogenase